MKIVAIIQARTSSERLPGKVLLEIKEKPLLQYLIERVAQCKGISHIVLCTSVQPEDDGIEKLGADLGVEVFRGVLSPVAERFRACLQKNPQWEAFFRICGDSPFLDQNLLEQAIEKYQEGYEIVTNILKRTYPKGQSIELVSRALFMRHYDEIKQDEYFSEHVTAFFYQKLKEKIFNFECEKNLGDSQLSVDYINDFNAAKKIIKNMNKPHWQYPFMEIIRLKEKINGKN